MLRKLIKHELYATGKTLLPLYGITILISLLNRILSNVQSFKGPLKLIQAFANVAFGISIVATLFVTFVIIILRFYKNLMTDEGYLMFTLPAKPIQLINSKFIVSLLWFVISVVIAVSALLILFITPERMNFISTTWRNIISVLKSSFGDNYILLIIEFILMIILIVIQQILLIYVSIAVGNLFTGHRVLGSFASYFGITTVVQIVLTLLMLIWVKIMGSSIEELDAMPQKIFPFSIIVMLILSTLYYFGTNYIFSKKLNLE